MGHLRQISYHLVEEPAMLLIKTLNFDRPRLVYKIHENMHILLAFITNSPETKVKLATKIIVTQHL